MSAPIVALSITYDYWPMAVIDSQPIYDAEHADTALTDLFHKSLTNIRDPTKLPPDIMTVELEIGPMNLAVFGVLFRFLWNIKENYLGESQMFSEMSLNFFDKAYVHVVAIISI